MTTVVSSFTSGARGRHGRQSAPADLVSARAVSWFALCLACAALVAASVFAAPAQAGWGLSDLSFVDQSYGWAVGLQADPPMYAVLQTTDGGVTWTVQKSTDAFNGTGLDVGFVSRTRGVWINSYLYSTADGGGTWKQRKVPGRWGGASFVDYATPSVVWVAGSYGSDGTGRCVARSTNGGRSWSLCLSQSTAAGRMPTSLSAPSGTIAYIWSGGLMVTRDAGHTWTTVNVHHPFKLTAQWMLSFPTATAGWMLQYDSAQLFRTIDGGAHWTQQMATVKQHFFGMDFVSARVGWVIGAAGAVYRTVDGGATWSYHKVPTTENLTSIDFIDGDHGWVATDAGLGEENSVYRTSNGGATWSRAR